MPVTLARDGQNIVLGLRELDGLWRAFQLKGQDLVYTNLVAAVCDRPRCPRPFMDKTHTVDSNPGGAPVVHACPGALRRQLRSRGGLSEHRARDPGGSPGVAIRRCERCHIDKHFHWHVGSLGKSSPDPHGCNASLSWPFLEGCIMSQGRKTQIRILLSEENRSELESWQRSTSISAGLARRARVVLMLAAGTPVSQTARVVGIERRHVYKWARRFLDAGLSGLGDLPRGRRPSRRLDLTMGLEAT